MLLLLLLRKLPSAYSMCTQVQDRCSLSASAMVRSACCGAAGHACIYIAGLQMTIEVHAELRLTHTASVGTTVLRAVCKDKTMPMGMLDSRHPLATASFTLRKLHLLEGHGPMADLPLPLLRAQLQLALPGLQVRRCLICWLVTCPGDKAVLEHVDHAVIAMLTSAALRLCMCGRSCLAGTHCMEMSAGPL